MFTEAAAIARKKKYEEKCKLLFETIDPVEFEKFYNSHNDKETKEFYKLTSTQLNRYLKQFDIKKSIERFILLQRRTRKEKYGDPTYRNMEKNYKTKLERYGDPHYNNPKKISDTYKNKTKQELEEINKKRLQTNLTKYGSEHPSATEEIKNRVMATNMERYGVPYFCMLERCRRTSFNNSTHNTKVEEVLNTYNISYKREFWIHRYSFDFLLTDFNIVIEVDPFPFHNTTWSPYGQPKDKYYHQNKSICAKENGYSCVHIFDWTDFDYIITSIISKERSFKVSHFEEPRRFIYDTKNGILTENVSKYTVDIYDDGAVYD